jgi:ABC-type Zn2+ transport system substrate-binding protein/surface adhesin
MAFGAADNTSTNIIIIANTNGSPPLEPKKINKKQKHKQNTTRKHECQHEHEREHEHEHEHEHIPEEAIVAS